MPQLGLGLGLHRANRALFRGLLDQYAGAAAAYSLRALSSGWLAGDVVEVRPSSGWTPASFTAGQVANGDLLDYVKRPGNFTNDGFETFANNGTGDGFTGINSSSSGLAYSSTVSGGLNDVVTIDFDITIVSGSPALSLRDGVPQPGGLVSNLEIINTSGSKSIVLTATGNFVNFTFSEGDTPSEFTVSNVRVSTNDGFVSKWYDQSGNGNDAIQITTTSQPKIVDAGALVADGIDFDGTDDFFALDLGADLAQPNSIFMVHESDTTSDILNEFFDASGTPRTLLDQSGTSYRMLAGISSESGLDVIANQKALVGAFYNSASSFLSKDGAVSSTFDVGTDGIDNLSNIGKSQARYYDGKMDEFIIYNSNQSANRAAIETNINAAYSIYA